MTAHFNIQCQESVLAAYSLPYGVNHREYPGKSDHKKRIIRKKCYTPDIIRFSDSCAKARNRTILALFYILYIYNYILYYIIYYIIYILYIIYI